MFRCRICDKEFDPPRDAIAIGKLREAYQLYRFQNGEVHDLTPVKRIEDRRENCRQVGKHSGLHIKKEGCRFYFPESEPNKETAQAEEKQ